MLQKQTIEPNTFALLEELQKLEILQDFTLVGGTALSLYYGHRLSIDLDLFSTEKFEVDTILKELVIHFGNRIAIESSKAKWGIFCFINDIKVDLINYPHKPLFPAETFNGIKLYREEDIAAMKINAILGRGKKKDFWDLAELLQHFSFKEIADFHKQKYPNQQLLISIPQAITYFDDAEESENPVSLKGQTWESVKKNIQAAVRAYLA